MVLFLHFTVIKFTSMKITIATNYQANVPIDPIHNYKYRGYLNCIWTAPVFIVTRSNTS